MFTLFCLIAAYRMKSRGMEAFGWVVGAAVFPILDIIILGILFAGGC